MKPLQRFLLLLLLPTFPLSYGQRAPNAAKQIPIETTVCKVLDNPSTYDNKLVKLRGYVRISSEYSGLIDEHCPDSAIWFALADGSGPPGLQAMVNGKGIPGSKDSKGRRIPPIPIHLVRDENFAQLQHFLAVSAKGEACADGPPPDTLPDCTTYRVTATFTGRIDSISKKVQEARRKETSQESTDWNGFGHMGMFDAQIVVQSVENVVAVDEAEIRSPKSN